MYSVFVVVHIPCVIFDIGFLFCGFVHGVLSSLANILLRESAGCLFGCLCSFSFPHDVVNWSAVRNCDISWSYSLTLFQTQF